MEQAPHRCDGQPTEACVPTGRPSMNERIAINPNIRFGKPCIAGTRISVQDVLELVREDTSFEQIVREYFPTISQQDIEACIQYAVDLVANEDIHVASVP